MSAPDLAPGTVVGGRYTVASRIGRGARSTTYRASNGGASEVALKVYDPALLPAGVLDSLRRAGEVAAAATSAALAPLDAGVDPASGAPFAVEELCARPSLAQLVELCPLAPADVVALARSLARALGPLHERGLSHGALAPTNVFVGSPPACEVRLSDFAAPAEPGAPSAAVATDVDGAARVVSFALTGRPFGSPGPQPDAAWSAVFRRAMHPRTGDAFASLEALADAFERVARGEAPAQGTAAPAWSPPPVAPAGPAAPEVARNTRVAAPWMVALGAVAFLLLAVCVAVAVKLARRPSSEPAASVVASAEPAPEASSAAPEPPPEPPPEPSTAASEVAAGAPESASADVPPPPPDVPTLPPHDHRHALLVVACTPSCDSVFVDGHPIPHAERGKLMDPGVHTVGANLANHGSRVQAVMLRQGRVKRLVVNF